MASAPEDDSEKDDRKTLQRRDAAARLYGAAAPFAVAFALIALWRLVDVLWADGLSGGGGTGRVFGVAAAALYVVALAVAAGVAVARELARPRG